MNKWNCIEQMSILFLFDDLTTLTTLTNYNSYLSYIWHCLFNIFDKIIIRKNKNKINNFLVFISLNI
jgi:hypothetical protein